MSGKSVRVALPPELADLLAPTGAGLSEKVKEALVIHLFQQEVISSGKAAELLGISWDAFRELHQAHGIPYFRQTIEEVLQDAEVSAAARRERRRDCIPTPAFLSAS